MYRTILVATDGSEYSDAAAAHAIDLAHKYDAALHALSVIEMDVSFSETISEQMLKDLEGRGQKAVDTITARAHDAGVTSVEGTVVRGTPHRAIVDYAHDHGADLVVVGTHGRRGLDRLLLGSVAERVLRTADVPVLVVREKKAE
ncbi:universal stress protein [Halogranum rubrum]|nr:universal stress protein [Halogranum salarium]